MREFISKEDAENIIIRFKGDEECMLIIIEGRITTTINQYFYELRKVLRLSDTFSNNLNSYSDMLRDEYSYYNKENIVFVIKDYNCFLSDYSRKNTIEKIFDEDIIPYFKHIRVLCVK